MGSVPSKGSPNHSTPPVDFEHFMLSTPGSISMRCLVEYISLLSKHSVGSCAAESSPAFTPEGKAQRAAARQIKSAGIDLCAASPATFALRMRKEKAGASDFRLTSPRSTPIEPLASRGN